MKGTFGTFCATFDPAFFRERRFMLPVIEAAEKVLRDKSRYLSVSLPQGSGKSYFANLLTVYMALLWRVAGKPITIMRICNTNKNAVKFKKQVQAILESPVTLQFFGVRLQYRTNTQNEIHLEGDPLPLAYFYSVGTSTMSQRCDVIIYDDLYESMAEAMSRSADDNLKLKHQTEWVGRLDGTRQNLKMQISVGTRYTKSDFYQYFIDCYSPLQVVQPGLVDGRSFCEAVKSTPDMQMMHRTMSADLFNAVIQQRPTAEGLLRIFANHTFARVDYHSCRFAAYYTVADPAKMRGGDWFVCLLCGITADGGLVVIDSFISNYATTQDYYSYLSEIDRRLTYCEHYIESNGVGGDILADPQRSVDLHGFSSGQNKLARIYAGADAVKSVAFCNTCDNLNLIFSELAKFPNADHDDIPDALNSACTLIGRII